MASEFAIPLLEAGLKVIDLSADFRFSDLDLYGEWYGEHRAPDLVGKAAYGLPEVPGAPAANGAEAEKAAKPEKAPAEAAVATAAKE